MKSKLIISIFTATLILFSGCGLENDGSTELSSDTNGELHSQDVHVSEEDEYLTYELNALVDALLEENEEQIQNGIFKIVIPSVEYSWDRAWGYADPETKQLASDTDQFYAASIGKMTLATLTMQFVEKGYLELDDPISLYLEPNIVKNLHVLNGIDYSDDITVRHLISHRSGLQDYFEDTDENFNQIPDFQELMIENPSKIWEPEEVIEYTKTYQPALFAPGSKYHYSDTGFVLMGMVLEAVSETDLTQLYREFLWEPLDMNDTYLYFREDPVKSDSNFGFAHAFSLGFNMTKTNMLSADWAGGGLITTTSDLYKFMSAWQNDLIFSEKETKQLQTDYYLDSDYGLGLWSMVIEGFSGTLIGHEGSTQSFMWYVPEYDAYIIGTLNQTVKDEKINMYTFIKEALALFE